MKKKIWILKIKKSIELLKLKNLERKSMLTLISRFVSQFNQENSYKIFDSKIYFIKKLIYM